MKAIIISDDSKTIEVLDKTLIEHGFDTIIYKWLLKALDNIEEIRPSLVIVSVNEYPRHWKTLTQFIASGIGGDETKVLLLCQTPLSEDERKKAAALGVKGFFSGITEDGISQLKSFVEFFFPRETETVSPKSEETAETDIEAQDVPVEKEINIETTDEEKVDIETEIETPNAPVEKEATIEVDVDDTSAETFDDDEVPTVSAIIAQKQDVVIDTAPTSPEQELLKQEINEVLFNSEVADAVLLFTNPHTGRMVTGKVLSYKNKIVDFIPESHELAADIKPGDTIDILTFELDSKVQNYIASVISKTDKIFIKLIEEING